MKKSDKNQNVLVVTKRFPRAEKYTFSPHYGKRVVIVYALRKHAYSNILKILSPKTDFFSDKKY